MADTSGPPSTPSWQTRLFCLLLLFTLGVTITTLAGEAFKSRLVGNLRFADLEELVVNGPLFLVSLVLLNDLFVQGKAPRALRLAFLALTVSFMFGYGMRIASNSVNAFATEIHNYLGVIPPDVYALLYFFDENLAHLIVYLSCYGLFTCLLIFEARYLASPQTARPQGWALAGGVAFGFCQAVVFLEGQKLYLVPVVLIGLGTVWVWLWRRSRQPLGDFIKTGPATAFMVGLLVMPIGLLLWFLFSGGWCEPSQYFLGRCK